MGIFSRLTDIVNSNLTALLDKAEDPQKMIRLIIQEMEETLVEVRSSSARVIADKKESTRRITRLHDEIAEWEGKAKLAISKGREDLAKAALVEKQAVADEAVVVEGELVALDEHLDHLNDEIGQLQQKLNDAKAKQKTMMMRAKTVESRIRVKRQIQKDSLNQAFNKFENFERRMDNLESEVEAMDLGRDANDLKSQINNLETDEKINDELEALKASMTKEK